MADNDVSIIIRVNDSEAERLRKVANVAREMGASFESASADMRRATETQRAVAASGEQITRVNRQNAATARESAEAEMQMRRALLDAQSAARMRAQAVQDGIERELMAMRQRNALLGASTELERIDRQIRLGNYAAYTATQTAELRNLAAEYDAKKRLLDVDRQRAAFRGNAAGAALSYAGFGLNPLAAGVAITAATGAFASRTSLEFERAEMAIEAVTGSLTEARQQMALVEHESERLGASITTLARLSARFEAASRGTNLEGAKSRDIMLAVVEAAQKLSLRGEDTEGVLRAIEQMMSKGTIQAEELRGQLGDRLPGAFNIMARALNVSTAELDKMLKSGSVMSDEALPKFAAELRRTFGTDANSRIETTTANFQRLANEIRLLADSAGDRLNPALSKTSTVLAEILAAMRDDPGAAARAYYGGGLFGLADLASAMRRERDALVQIKKQTDDIFFNTGALAERAYKPGASAPFYGPGVPYVPDPIDLTAGVTPLDEKRVAKLQEELALLDKMTEYERTLYQYAEGELRNANHVERALALQLATRKDQITAEQQIAAVRKNAAVALDQGAERELRRAVELEEKEREQIRVQMTRNAILEEELRTGEKLTRSKQELIELEMQYAVVGERTLRQELERGDAIERQLEAREFYSKLFDQMERDAQRSLGNVNEFARQAARNVQDQLADTLVSAFDESADKILIRWLEMLQRMAAEAAAANLNRALFGQQFGETGELGGLIGLAANAAMSYFGYGGQATDVDLANQDPFGPVQYRGARASGGAVAPNSLYQVNEKGPEVLNYKGRDFLMVGGAGGYVKPVGGQASAGASGVTVNAPITVNVPESSSREDSERIAQEAQRGVDSAVRRVLLHEMRPGGMLRRGGQGAQQ